MKYKLATVVFTDRKLDAYQVSGRRKYAYVIEDDLKAGDMVESREYDNRMMVVSVFESDEPRFNGMKLKTLRPDVINGIKIKKMETNDMLSGIIAKYKSQFIPEKEEGVKLSADGAICIRIGDEYVGFKGDDLTSYPVGAVIGIPVYSINKPQSAVRVGDIIKNGRSFAKVVGINADGSLKVISFSGYTQNRKEIKDFMFGQSMVRVLVNMFNYDQSNGFNPFLFAMAEGDTFDAKTFMMLQMMPGAKGMFSNGNGMSNFNPMMLAFMDKNASNGSMMETLMMMSMMNGNQCNPFAMFNNAPTENANPNATTSGDAAVTTKELMDVINSQKELIKTLGERIAQLELKNNQ